MIIGPKLTGVLYHYTNHDSLYSIVESKSLRASHAYYMNDSSEIIYAVDQFIKLVKDRITQKIDEESTLQLLEQLLEWIKYLKLNPYFIFSFSLSEEGNLLSQWRAYTHHGTGVSIGFNFSDLDSYANRNNLSLIKCVYQVQEQNLVLKNVIDNILTQFALDKSSIEINKQPKGQEYHSCNVSNSLVLI